MFYVYITKLVFPIHIVSLENLETHSTVFAVSVILQLPRISLSKIDDLLRSKKFWKYILFINQSQSTQHCSYFLSLLTLPLQYFLGIRSMLENLRSFSNGLNLFLLLYLYYIFFVNIFPKWVFLENGSAHVILKYAL